jgi:hypothetical protein
MSSRRAFITLLGGAAWPVATWAQHPDTRFTLQALVLANLDQ